MGFDKDCIRRGNWRGAWMVFEETFSMTKNRASQTIKIFAVSLFYGCHQ
jgi:hypothetical protein